MQVPLRISSWALPFQTSVPWDRPISWTRSKNRVGLVSRIMSRAMKVPSSGSPSVARIDRRRAVRNAQGFGRLEQGHDPGVRDRDVADIDAGQVAEHLEHGRVIMAEDVQLEDRVVHGVEIEMGRDRARVRLVGRDTGPA